MADNFIKPPFFQWGVRPVASRGLGETEPPGDLVLRGWNVSTDDINGNFHLANSAGWFRFQLPSNYVPGTNLIIHLAGGIRSEGLFPAAVSTNMSFLVVITNGLPPHDVPISATGYSWAPGTAWTIWPAAGGSWSAEGVNPPLSLVVDGSTNGSSYLLNNGAGGVPNLPGEGTRPRTPTGQNPYGWNPNLSLPPDILPGQQMQPDQVLEVSFSLQTLPNDPANPARTAYPFVTSISVEVFGGATIDVPITSVTVGFGIGSAGLPWPAWPFPTGGYGAPWNEYRYVSLGLPPEAGVGEAGYQDVYLEGTAPPVAEDIRVTDNGDRRITDAGDTRVVV